MKASTAFDIGGFEAIDGIKACFQDLVLNLVAAPIDLSLFVWANDSLIAALRAATLTNSSRLSSTWPRQSTPTESIDWREHVEIDPRFLRPADTVALISDASRAVEAIDWRATTDMDELTLIMVDADLAGARK